MGDPEKLARAMMDSLESSAQVGAENDVEGAGDQETDHGDDASDVEVDSDLMETIAKKLRKEFVEDTNKMLEEVAAQITKDQEAKMNLMKSEQTTQCNLILAAIHGKTDSSEPPSKKSKPDEPIPGPSKTPIEKSFVEFFKQIEKTGDKISDLVAEGMQADWFSTMEKEDDKTAMSKYKLPQNCPRLVVPKCNEILWNDLPDATRQGDIWYQSLQSLALQSQLALQPVLEHFLKTQGENPEAEELMKRVGMSTKITSMLAKKVTLRRRDQMRDAFSPRFKKLAARSVEHSELLFGPELEKKIKEIADATAVLKTQSKKKKKFKMKSSSDNSSGGGTWSGGANSGKNSFLGKTGGKPQSPRQNNQGSGSSSSNSGKNYKKNQNNQKK